jgi:biotin carboxylase
MNTRIASQFHPAPLPDTVSDTVQAGAIRYRLPSLPKILILGASHAQMPVISKARQRGMYVITCDNIPENPGHRVAHECHLISTTDTEAIAAFAKGRGIDGILAYASDPAAPTAAWVAERFGLPGNAFDAVRTLCDKQLFRELLKEHGFNCPRGIVITDPGDLRGIDMPFAFPAVVKPVDSSGSKGVSVVHSYTELPKAVDQALSFSRSGRAIAEEFVDSGNGDLHGDGFFVDGKLVFSLIGDHIYDGTANPLNPAGTNWPSAASASDIDAVKRCTEEIAGIAGYRNGPVNIEARISGEGKVYIMEIGPRNGGHFVPQAIFHATGFDMVDAVLNLTMGEPVRVTESPAIPVSYYALHSRKDGILKSIDIDSTIEPYIVEKHIYTKPGDRVRRYTGSHAALGVAILSFADIRQQMEAMHRPAGKFRIVVQ